MSLWSRGGVGGGRGKRADSEQTPKNRIRSYGDNGYEAKTISGQTVTKEII